MKKYFNCSRSIVEYQDADGNRQQAYPGKSFESPVEIISRALIEVDPVTDIDAGAVCENVEQAETEAFDLDPADLAARAAAAGVKYDRRLSPKKMSQKIIAAMAMGKELEPEI